MSPIENKSIRIENERIVGDGNGEDQGKLFVFVEERVFSMKNDKLWRAFLNDDRTSLGGVEYIIGPSVVNVRGLPGKNKNGISISKKRGIAFKPAEITKGIWKETKSVKNR
jgi:hypothetical protein